MAVTSPAPPTRFPITALPVVTVLAVMAALALLLANAGGLAPLQRAVTQAAGDDLQAILITYSLMPRFAISVIAGLSLGVSGVLFQQILRNPLAEPGTLAVFSGAKALLFSAVLWMPSVLAFGQQPIIWLGGLAALATVFLLAYRSQFQPVRVILIGLMLSLSLEAYSGAAFLVHFEELSDLLSWQTGSLVQIGWDNVTVLLPILVGTGSVAWLLHRPLAVLDLGDDSARSAGTPVFALRLTGLLVAAGLSAAIAATVGPIGFVGLIGPAIARGLGARGYRRKLVYGALISAALLTVVDQGILRLTGGLDIPAGAMTALLGAPILIWLLRRAGRHGSPERPQHLPVLSKTHDAAGPGSLIVAVSLLGLACAIALTLGKLPDGWHFQSVSDIGAVLPWRLPRMVAAGAGGAMLAIAGCLIQRLTGNPVASPEILGLSSGGALVLMITIFFLPGLGRTGMMLLSGAGALLVLALLLWSGRRSGFASERMLLAGIALAALTGALTSLLALFGDMRVQRLLGWMAGSTYSVTERDAWLALLLAAISLALVPFLARWLAILPMGAEATRSLGIGVARSRLILMLLIGAMTGAATLLVGPLSFAGLVAPHLARSAGLNRPMQQVYGAAIIGATCMILADWLGRTIAFPWQIPAGTVATLLGSLYFLLRGLRHDRRV
ncbi:Fe(3+)-hydroxamate ABC transporter permease FhuB [Rhizobium sp. SSA_523]|uniref:Fe(3+)-hydroxamate ABC transporter permease FhuB n=1 Tax=Rhizobium sp. SSA_523 TaxID=2952477 RepID=UPI00209145EE|nr:Fe(3+)-hydroxamate ABC transporter permease FhuB [Rhizobium sp. SSA_523]MCO5731247.1 Fe(3+)-hydroxamate ABC transporter permease FhuB [Rhizobium sp. SSA_523]WKC22215.1 Fe(3+)-hydroxamate ABC transporter permease FhuB [Rhizobium sp. SSA_523]